ncbi:ABC-F family ATP-binding cassette domain-containing protein [Brevundimonas goettingensis]|uniref:ABC-F family ATP-binding cassette domain-containing protein n=1 Tax=Brevundimonas goettingensis TaxID=2774190 RepID=UPI0021F20B68|nr:ABC-F family ATP-binding cassette domain-containing protein [Brevundimonas goettingensis]
MGRNGVGKSTLLRILAGEHPPSGGTLARAGTVGMLDQRHEPGPHERVAETLGVGAGVAVLDRVLAGEGTEADLAEADWTLSERIEDALGQVGLAGLALDRLSSGLSGGELTRLRLAGLLIARPDLLLLDEPTNHLDADARKIVAEVLGRWKGGAVVVSHDRDLLRRMDRIVELSSLGAAVHGGNYDLYAEQKAAERAAARRDLASAEREVDRAAREGRVAAEKKARRDRAGRAYAASGSAPKIVLGMMAERAEVSGARESGLAERRTEAAEQALGEAQARVERVRELSIPLPPTGLAAGRTVLTMSGAAWDAPDGRRIVGPVDLSLTGPRRVAITGPNGAGKTTLLKLAAGLLEPTAGTVERPVRAALLDQETSLLRPEETVVEAFLRLNPGATPNAARAALARFLFRNTAGDRVVGTLSGGERLRAGLACVMGGENPSQLLILDEPTNHLDLDAVTGVEAALQAWDGALLVVSHDPAFLAAIGAEVEKTIALECNAGSHSLDIGDTRLI